MGQHRRQPTRPRYGRLAAALSSLGVTMVALLGGIGILPSSAGSTDGGSALALDSASAATAGSDPSPQASPLPSGKPPPAQTSAKLTKQPATSAVPVTVPLPADSGEGRRVVFSQGEQRVWLVQGDGSVERTYLVSGSLTDNLDPGTYAVYSRSEDAWGVDDSGSMHWFVRFTTGDAGAAIGFHDIPVDAGRPVQAVSQLGTEQSHGCIRQREADAKALWAFAPLDTTVVVTP